MSLLILFTTVLFLFIAFIANQPPEKILNPFYLYCLTELHFLLNNIFFFIVGFIVAIFLFISSQKFDKHYSLFKNYFFSTMQVFATVVVGFFASFLFLILIAFVELNTLALIINLNPPLLGIETNITIIVNSLKANNAPPEIIASDKDQSKELRAVATATTGNSNYYGKYILSLIPDSFVVPVKKSYASMLLIDNTLIITAINPRDMQTISPTIGYLFLKQYFWRRQIKSYPKLTLMDRNEYATYRLDDSKKKLLKIDLDIKKLDGFISSLSATIQNDQTILNSNKKDSNINDLSLKLQSEQNHLVQYEYYDNFFKTQKKVVQSLEKSLPNEQGVFEPKDSIKIALNTSSSHAIADYLATVTHEYLHYASYVSATQRFTDSFFEEGLTEYFARNIIQSELQVNTNLGYPVQVKIINEMTKIIPESELADIYFTKDEARLESTLGRVYGDSFYQNNQILFETLQYTSNRQQALKLANEIMKKIDGPQLKEKDLFSNYSKL